jgi:hypothetical protein
MTKTLLIQDIEGRGELCFICEEVESHCVTVINTISSECHDEDSIVLKFEEDEENDYKELIKDLYSIIAFILADNEFFSFSIGLI